MSVLLKQALDWTVLRPLIIYGVIFYILFQLTRKFLQSRKITKIVDRIPGPKSGLNPLGHIYIVQSNSRNDLITSELYSQITALIYSATFTDNIKRVY